MEVLKLLRGKRSQQEIANRLGISQRAYSNYERGDRECDYATLAKLATYFNVSIDYLITGKETTQEPQKPYEMELYEALSDDAKAIILRNIETLYKLENGELPTRINNLVLTKFDK